MPKKSSRFRRAIINQRWHNATRSVKIGLWRGQVLAGHIRLDLSLPPGGNSTTPSSGVLGDGNPCWATRKTNLSRERLVPSQDLCSPLRIPCASRGKAGIVTGRVRRKDWELSDKGALLHPASPAQEGQRKFGNRKKMGADGNVDGVPLRLWEKCPEREEK